MCCESKMVRGGSGGGDVDKMRGLGGARCDGATRGRWPWAYSRWKASVSGVEGVVIGDVGE